MRTRYKQALNRKRVMVGVGVGYGFGRDMIAGVVSYARAHGPWEFVGQITLVADAKAIRQAPAYDGLIFHFLDEEFGRAAIERGTPAVSVGGDAVCAGISHVATDAEAIGEMAYDHLAGLGLTNFAVYGGRRPFRRRRLDAFAARVESNGQPCVDLGQGSRHGWSSVAKNRQWSREVVRLKRRLKPLETRLGVFTWSSEDARPLVAACDELSIAVPDQLAVLGVDDDEAICELANPPISAIDHGCETVGWEAARMLDRLMAGDATDTSVLHVPPVRVVVRQSTDTLSIEDPLVVQAVRWIEERLDQAIRVEDVLAELGVSRPTLEQRFRHTLGRTVHRHLIYARINRAKELLLATDLDLATISVRCGFSYPSKFSTIFRRETGSSPTDYRLNHRMRTGP
ncbi:MAG: substrate-binding domain-containing protein [Planctomycetota bacterium]